jgi:hypothetical protein
MLASPAGPAREDRSADCGVRSPCAQPTITAARGRSGHLLRIRSDGELQRHCRISDPEEVDLPFGKAPCVLAELAQFASWAAHDGTPVDSAARFCARTRHRSRGTTRARSAAPGPCDRAEAIAHIVQTTTEWEKTDPMSTLRTASAMTCLLVAALASCGGKQSPESPSTDSRSLRECASDVDCAGEGSCLCGRCTIACSDTCSAGPAGTQGIKTSTCTTPVGGACLQGVPDAGSGDGPSDGDGASQPEADAGDTGPCTGPLEVVKETEGSCAAT